MLVSGPSMHSSVVRDMSSILRPNEGGSNSQKTLTSCLRSQRAHCWVTDACVRHAELVAHAEKELGVRTLVLGSACQTESWGLRGAHCFTEHSNIQLHCFSSDTNVVLLESALIDPITLQLLHQSIKQRESGVNVTLTMLPMSAPLSLFEESLVQLSILLGFSEEQAAASYRSIVSESLCMCSTTLPNNYTGMHFWLGTMFLHLQPEYELELLRYRCLNPVKAPALREMQVIPWFSSGATPWGAFSWPGSEVGDGSRRHWTLLRTLTSTIEAAMDLRATASVEYIKEKLNDLELQDSDESIEKLLEEFNIKKWMLPTVSGPLPAGSTVRSSGAPECCIVCSDTKKNYMRMECCVATMCVSCAARWFSGGNSCPYCRQPPRGQLVWNDIGGEAETHEEAVNEELMWTMGQPRSRRVVAVFESEELMNNTFCMLTLIEHDDWNVWDSDGVGKFMRATGTNHLLLITSKELRWSGFDTGDCIVMLCEPFRMEPQYYISPDADLRIIYYHSAEQEFLWRWASAEAGNSNRGYMVCPFSKTILRIEM